VKSGAFDHYGDGRYTLSRPDSRNAAHPRPKTNPEAQQAQGLEVAGPSLLRGKSGAVLASVLGH
jgi:hypothetical protein